MLTTESALPAATAPREPPFVIGYFARVCPEKGFHNLVDAFIELRKTPGVPAHRLRASGWLGENDRPYFDQQVAKLKAAGMADDVPSLQHDLCEARLGDDA